MKKVLKYVMIAMLLGLTSLASAAPVGQIDIVNGGHVFRWSNDVNMRKFGFITPIVLAANEEFTGIRVYSKRMCFASSTTTGRYNPGKLELVIPGTASNDASLFYKGVVTNKTTKNERLVSVLIDNWSRNPSLSNAWKLMPNKTITYGNGNAMTYNQPTVTYTATTTTSGTVYLRSGADVLSGFILNNVPMCSINPDNVSQLVLAYSTTGATVVGSIVVSGGTYIIVFAGVKPNVPFTIKMVMYKGNQIRWFDFGSWIAGINTTFNINNGTITAH